MEDVRGVVRIGNSDRFVDKKSRTELLEAPFVPEGIALSLRHRYPFIAQFMPDDVAWLVTGVVPENRPALAERL